VSYLKFRLNGKEKGKVWGKRERDWQSCTHVAISFQRESFQSAGGKGVG